MIDRYGPRSESAVQRGNDATDDTGPGADLDHLFAAQAVEIAGPPAELERRLQRLAHQQVGQHDADEDVVDAAGDAASDAARDSATTVRAPAAGWGLAAVVLLCVGVVPLVLKQQSHDRLDPAVHRAPITHQQSPSRSALVASPSAVPATEAERLAADNVAARPSVAVDSMAGDSVAADVEVDAKAIEAEAVAAKASAAKARLMEAKRRNAEALLKLDSSSPRGGGASADRPDITADSDASLSQLQPRRAATYSAQGAYGIVDDAESEMNSAVVPEAPAVAVPRPEAGSQRAKSVLQRQDARRREVSAGLRASSKPKASTAYRRSVDSWRAEIMRLIERRENLAVITEWRLYTRQHPQRPFVLPDHLQQLNQSLVVD